MKKDIDITQWILTLPAEAQDDVAGLPLLQSLKSCANPVKFSIVFLLLASCSFTPMLKKSDDTAVETGSKLVVESANKDGSSYAVQMMRQRLRGVLSGLNLTARYKVYVRLNEESGNLAYATDATSTRSMMRLSAQILVNCEGQTVYETRLANVTSYSQNTNDEFVNQSAVQGAQERLIESLTIDISRELQRFTKDQSKN